MQGVGLPQGFALYFIFFRVHRRTVTIRVWVGCQDQRDLSDGSHLGPWTVLCVRANGADLQYAMLEIDS